MGLRAGSAISRPRLHRPGPLSRLQVVTAITTLLALLALVTTFVLAGPVAPGVPQAPVNAGRLGTIALDAAQGSVQSEDGVDPGEPVTSQTSHTSPTGRDASSVSPDGGIKPPRVKADPLDYTFSCPHLDPQAPLVVQPGGTGSATCSTVSRGSLSGPLTLGCNAPSPVSCRFEESPMALAAGATIRPKLLVQVSQDAAPGLHQLNISVQSGSWPSENTYVLLVQVPFAGSGAAPGSGVEAGFSITCSGPETIPAEQPFAPRPCLILPVGGFTGEVRMAIASPARGVSVVPSVMVAGGDSPTAFPVTIDTGTAGPGDHSVKLTGTSGGMTRETAFRFSVAAPAPPPNQAPSEAA